MTWLASPAATELELTVLDWLAQLLGLPRELARPHRGHGVDVDGRRARRGAHAPARRRRLRVGAGELQRREGGAARRARVPQGRGRRRVPDARRLPARRRDRGRRDRRDDRRRRPSIRCPSSRAAARRRACGCTSTPRMPGRRAVCPELRWCLEGCRPRRLASSSTRTNGCSRRWTARRSGRGGPRCCTRRSRSCRSTSRRRDGAVDIKDYGPALGRRFRALKLWFVLRWYGAEGLRALIREHVRLAQLFASWSRRSRAGRSSRRIRSRPCASGTSRRDNDALARAATATGELFVASTRLRGQTMIRLAIGNARDDRGRRPPLVGGACSACAA